LTGQSRRCSPGTHLAPTAQTQAMWWLCMPAQRPRGEASGASSCFSLVRFGLAWVWGVVLVKLLCIGCVSMLSLCVCLLSTTDAVRTSRCKAPTSRSRSIVGLPHALVSLGDIARVGSCRFLMCEPVQYCTKVCSCSVGYYGPTCVHPSST
jgi:hypothetical protein